MNVTLAIIIWLYYEQIRGPHEKETTTQTQISSCIHMKTLSLVHSTVGLKTLERAKQQDFFILVKKFEIHT